MTTIWQQVRVYLVTHPDSAVWQIAGDLGLEDTSVRRALNNARGRGEVRRSGTRPMVWWVGGEKPQARTAMPRLSLGKVQAIVVEALKASDEPLSSTQLGELLGLKRATRDRTLQRLADRKAILRVQERPRAVVKWRWAA